MTKVAIIGANGRMGKMLMAQVAASEHCALGAAIVRNQALHGTDTDFGITFSTHIDDIADCDVAIDFSLPDALSANLATACAHNVALVIGTTGLCDSHFAEIDKAGKHIGVVYSGNYSLGINLLLGLVAQSVHALPNADIEIIETHHRHKLDAPSGTALMLANVASDSKAHVFGRHGQMPRKDEIGIHAVRGGEIIGDHSVLFALPHETITLHHHAQDRTLFAQGALVAAQWIVGKVGRFDMQDVLGLRRI